MSKVFAEHAITVAQKRFNLMIVAMALVLGCLWAYWFLFGKLPIMEKSIEASMLTETTIKAEFPLSSNSIINLGNPALIEFEDLSWPLFSLAHGIVKHKRINTTQKSLSVILELTYIGEELTPLYNNTPAKVQVIVDRVSPIKYFFKKNQGLLLSNFDGS